jgi:hypothetical protein
MRLISGETNLLISNTGLSVYSISEYHLFQLFLGFDGSLWDEALSNGLAMIPKL